MVSHKEKCSFLPGEQGGGKTLRNSTDLGFQIKILFAPEEPQQGDISGQNIGYDTHRSQGFIPFINTPLVLLHLSAEGG